MCSYRYNLSLAESKKSLVCVEHELQKGEGKWAAERDVEAEIRLLKEQRYLNNCAASERMHQKCVAVV